MNRLQGTLVLPQGPARGEVSFDETIRAVRVEGDAIRTDRAEPPFVLPGFIDVHVHGGGGGDTMDGVDGVRALAAFHARHGTTTLLPTTITNPFDRILAALRGVREAMDEPGGSGAAARAEPVRADIVGAHLEGPFISPQRLGAQPAHAVPATAERVAAVLETGAVRVVTLAPEIEGAPAAAERFAAAGVRVSVGHTRASYDEVGALAKRVRGAGGVVGFTHLYNAMGGLAGRAPGVVAAALADEEAFAELILDLHHVHAGSALAAWAAKRDRLMLVTDAIRAAGRSDGTTELGGQEVRVSGGAARLSDGTLAGSVLTLDAALRNAVSLGVGIARASHALSAAPASYLGLADRGRIEEGLRADLVVLDASLGVREVWVGGRRSAA